MKLLNIFGALFVGIIFMALPIAVHAGDYTYTTNSGKITITGYIGSGGAVIIPNTISGFPVTAIGTNAFYSRTNLTSVTIGTNVTSIGNSAFYSCSRLTSVTIGINVISIGNSAFYSCTNLTGSFTIPSSVTSIGSSAFYRCSGLTTITVDTNNSVYSSVDGVLFNKSQTALIQCPAGKTGNCTIPAGVISIGSFAFNDCAGLTGGLTIPAGVTAIGTAAFQGCTNLTGSLTIPAGVTNIGSYAFNSCRSLTGSLTIPAGVTSIGTRMFSYCAGLTGSLSIPAGVTSIGTNAFYGCSGLTSITIPDSVTSIGDTAFEFCASLTGVSFNGNAPSVGLDVFYGATSATVYRVSGATGWPTVPNLWGGLPTALWQPDSNDNGIPDSWEQQYFGGSTNANPNAICSNGINTVRQAYIAGLDPNDPQSRLLISDFQSLTDGKTLGWNAVSGRVYSVYWTTNLMNGFQPLETNIPWTRNSFTNQSSVPCGYYKIDVRLE